MTRSSHIRKTARRLARAAVNAEGTRGVVLREYLFRALARVTPYVAVDSDGVRYFVSTADQSVGRETFVRRGYDVEVMERLIGLAEEAVGRRPLLAGRTFIDIGANIGTTTIPALIRYGAADAVAFEPVPETFALLQCNIVVNGLASRAQAVCVALSDTEGTATMEVSDLSAADSRVRLADSSAPGLLGEDSWRTTEVTVRRFDDVRQDLDLDLDRVGLVWIDTQGHEANVLAGARSILERALPLVVEYWPYGLRRVDALDRLHGILQSAYGTFTDARVPGPPAPMPLTSLPELAERYTGPGDYTDLLVMP